MAMLGIFFIHCKFPGTAGKFIGHMASLAVPFFFASSGYFNCYTDKKKCIKRFQHMCLIVVLANGFYFVYDFLEIVITKGNLTEFFKETFTVRKAVVFLILNESPLRGHLWFLGALACCYLAHWCWLSIYCVSRHGETKSADEGKWMVIAMSLLFVANYCGERYLRYIGLSDKVTTYIRNWLLMGIPFYLLGIQCRRWGEQHPGSDKVVKLCLIILSGLFLTDLALITQDSLTYLPTIPIIGCLIIMCGFSGEIEPPRLLKKAAIFYRGNGILFYILQIAEVRVIDAAAEEIGIAHNMVWRWCRPMAACMILFLLLFVLGHLKQVLLKADSGRISFFK